MVKRILIIIGGLVVGTGLALVASWYLAELRLAPGRIDVTPRPLMRQLPEAEGRRERRALRRLEREEAQRLARAPETGQRLMTAILDCAACHGDDLGGAAYIDSGAFGRIVAPNLTPGIGSVTREYADDDWVRAIRHGVGPGGRFLLLMPSKGYSYLDDDEMLGVLHYLKQVAPVDRDLGSSEPGVIARFLLASGNLDLDGETLDHGRLGMGAPAPGPTQLYGEHLLRISGCQRCHGERLTGSGAHGGPDAPDIRASAMDGWDFSQFQMLMREGRRQDGSAIDPWMPQQIYRHMSDDDLRALWAVIGPAAPPPRIPTDDAAR